VEVAELSFPLSADSSVGLPVTVFGPAAGNSVSPGSPALLAQTSGLAVHNSVDSAVVLAEPTSSSADTPAVPGSSAVPAGSTLADSFAGSSVEFALSERSGIAVADLTAASVGLIFVFAADSSAGSIVVLGPTSAAVGSSVAADMAVAVMKYTAGTASEAGKESSASASYTEPAAAVDIAAAVGTELVASFEVADTETLAADIEPTVSDTAKIVDTAYIAGSGNARASARH
jgi:hypothetical protein